MPDVRVSVHHDRGRADRRAVRIEREDGRLRREIEALKLLGRGVAVVVLDAVRERVVQERLGERFVDVDERDVLGRGHALPRAER
jgi:hypothetical protein